MSPQQLRSALTYPAAFGPTEWGPIPYLPDPDLLVQVLVHTLTCSCNPPICLPRLQTGSASTYSQSVWSVSWPAVVTWWLLDLTAVAIQSMRLYARSAWS